MEIERTGREETRERLTGNGQLATATAGLSGRPVPLPA